MSSNWNWIRAGVLGLGAALALGACGEETEEDAAPIALRLPIRAMVGDQAFACGQTYQGLGRTGASTWTPRDFRLYVYNVRLITASGEEVPVALTQDGAWQDGDVALLDYEDASADCANGTPQRNGEVVGEAPAGDYTGITFGIGVPFARNHENQATAPSPLNISGLFWSWQSGYKFARIDGFTEGLPQGYNLHLGATGCQGEVGEVTGCDNENRPEVRLEGWTPGEGLVLDLGALLGEAALDADLGGQPGCMSNPMDMDCPPIFKALGLSDATQSFVRVDK